MRLHLPRQGDDAQGIAGQKIRHSNAVQQGLGSGQEFGIPGCLTTEAVQGYLQGFILGGITFPVELLKDRFEAVQLCMTQLLQRTTGVVQGSFERFADAGIHRVLVIQLAQGQPYDLCFAQEPLKSARILIGHHLVLRDWIFKQENNPASRAFPIAAKLCYDAGMPNTWTVSQDDAGARLDVFLAGKLPEMTRSQIAKFLKAGTGKVNGKSASVHRFLHPGDVVEFGTEGSAQGKTDIPAEKRPAMPLPELRIIDETKDFIVLDKPAGVLVHPDSKQLTGTLVDALVAHDPKIAKIGENPERPGIMHRLDKEVSGLMVVAKTQDAFDSLKAQFAEHSVDKTYLALVHGEMENEEGDIKFRIARSKTKTRMAARPAHEEEGKAAWTHYRTLKRFRNASLLELSIFSGRTHQIRAHLLALNHPVIGDVLYGRKSENRNIKAPRLMLQCVKLGFKDPMTGELRKYELPPVKEFAEVEKMLK